MGRSLAVLTVLAACLASCGSPARVSNAAPPLVICGKLLSNSAAGPTIDDASLHDHTITSVTVGGLIFLRVSVGCESGAGVTIEPSGSADVVEDARASDGRFAAVVLRPHRNTFTIRVTHSPALVTVATVQGLSVEPTPTS